ncbi:hypothetical protein HELRODRAFT_159100 [Helobdella robusta]|uniref:C-type lectin domain-containing protein n=1 Tax=Helobdella robusta TaxID=6412 RepID=T1ENL2_HELRO|nr:hypothetical protein HELRODRAFT_159100 [Helobdella robusta]ESO12542.1 hypothetical protein HELRODRAFT_159100 [Helobdella robusta]
MFLTFLNPVTARTANQHQAALIAKPSPLQNHGDYSEAKKCPNGFRNILNKCVKVVTERQTGNKAFETCKQLGANLAILNSKTYFDKLTKYLMDNFRESCTSTRSSGSFWTAGHRLHDTNVFVWKPSKLSKHMTGHCRNAIITKNWAKNQPDNTYNNEDCVEMFIDGNEMKFNDLPCAKGPNYIYKNCAVCQTNKK